MKAILAISISLFTLFANAQTVNDATNWEITLTGDTATYHIIKGENLKLKRSETATFHKLSMNGHGTETNCKFYAASNPDSVLAKMNIYMSIPKRYPYIDITGLSPGKYYLKYVACNAGGKIAIEIE